MLLGRTLRREGDCAVTEATNGIEALDLLARPEQRPQMVRAAGRSPALMGAADGADSAHVMLRVRPCPVRASGGLP